MEQELGSLEFEKLFQSKLIEKRDSTIEGNLLIQTKNPDIVGDGLKLMIENLQWFHQMKDVPESLKSYFENDSCDLGE
jgi:hypothetical protein